MTALDTNARKPILRRLRGADEIPVWLWIVGVFVALYLVLPTLFVIPMSWSEATTFVFPPRGFTLRLYQNFFTNERWIGSLGHSVLVAVLRLGAGLDGRHGGGARIKPAHRPRREFRAHAPRWCRSRRRPS